MIWHWLWIGGLILLAYLAGSIPFGLLVGLSRGIDVRQAGSGNIGATNVGRLLGGRYFFLVFFLDLLKGLLPTLLAGWLLRRNGWLSNGDLLIWLAVAAAAILGHLFSAFLKFSGGKGVATSAGAMLGLFPYFTFAALAAVAVWVAIFFIWRYVSLASILAAAAFPLAYYALWGWRPELLALNIAALFMPLLIIYKHRSNLGRLRSGSEKKFTTARS